MEIILIIELKTMSITIPSNLSPRVRVLLSLLILSILSGCATSGSKSPSEKRAKVLEMRQEVLADFFEEKPAVRNLVATEPGYAVFSNANINLLIASFGAGYGVVHNNQTRQDTFMNMSEVGLGFGAGVKDFRILLVFHSDEALNYFINKGWTLGAQADATAKASDKGGDVNAETIINNVSVYQLTKAGLAVQATVKGTKFWKNKELNQQ